MRADGVHVSVAQGLHGQVLVAVGHDLQHHLRPRARPIGRHGLEQQGSVHTTHDGGGETFTEAVMEMVFVVVVVVVVKVIEWWWWWWWQ